MLGTHPHQSGSLPPSPHQLFLGGQWNVKNIIVKSSGIAQFVKNNFVKIHKDNQTWNCLLLCQEYLWCFYSRPMGGRISVRGWKNRMTLTLEVLVDERMGWGLASCLVRLGQVSKVLRGHSNNTWHFFCTF